MFRVKSNPVFLVWTCEQSSLTSREAASRRHVCVHTTSRYLLRRMKSWVHTDMYLRAQLIVLCRLVWREVSINLEVLLSPPIRRDMSGGVQMATLESTETIRVHRLRVLRFFLKSLVVALHHEQNKGRGNALLSPIISCTLVDIVHETEFTGTPRAPQNTASFPSWMIPSRGWCLESLTRFTRLSKRNNTSQYPSCFLRSVIYEKIGL